MANPRENYASVERNRVDLCDRRKDLSGYGLVRCCSNLLFKLICGEPRVDMVTPVKLSSLKGPSGWTGGGLLALAVGMHGLLLAMPLPTPAPPQEPIVQLETTNSTEVIDVVRLPAAASALPPSAPPPAAPSPPVIQPQAQIAPTRAQTPPPAAPAPAPKPAIAPEPSPPEAPNPEQEELLAIPPGLTYNNQVKALRNDPRDFVTWYSEQDWGDNPDQIPLPGRKTLSALQVSYPEPLCLPIPPAPGRLEVIVKGDGTLMRPPRLLATTGYDELDALALQQATQQDFSGAAQQAQLNPSVYWLPIEIGNDGHCSP
jgi:hypothetical protein